MKKIRLTEDSRKHILEQLLKRSPASYGEYESRVARIVSDVRQEGDSALFRYTEQLDQVKLTGETIKVTREEVEEAYRATDPSLLEVIRRSLANIKAYHEKQKRYSWFDSTPEGTILGQKVTPLSVVGIYAPAGRRPTPPRY